MKTLKRVVITGMGAISPLGNDWETVRRHLFQHESGIRHMTDWDSCHGLNTRVGAPAAPFELDPVLFNRKKTRAMGRVAVMAVKATMDALADAGLTDHPIVRSGDMGIAYGSSSGQPNAVAELSNLILSNSCRGITATTYVRMMAHTAPVNIGVYFGVKGRIITTSSACTSGSQGIGYAYEAIQSGKQVAMIAGGSEELHPTDAAIFDTLFASSACTSGSQGIGYAYEAIQSGKQVAMIAGGSEELHPTDAAIFDTLFATSVKYNDTPELTPRPFDRDRDGLVVGEGAGTLILEELEHARARGARIYAEILGFGTNSDGAHITTPQSEQMARAMQLALEEADLTPADIDVVNGHGTGTDRGDAAESAATYSVFGSHTPYTTYKGHMGHTLGACGALETIFAIRGMQEGFVSPILNLAHPAEDCAPLDYVMGDVRELPQSVLMTNNFAFGGINTSLILKRWTDHE